MPVICTHGSPSVADSQTTMIPVTGPGDINELGIFCGTAIPDMSVSTPEGPELHIVIPLPAGHARSVAMSSFNPVAFVALSSEEWGDGNCNFQINEVSANWKETTILAAMRLDILGDGPGDDRINRVAYQVCAPLIATSAFVPTVVSGCELSRYADFAIGIVASADQDINSAANPSRVDFILSTTNNIADILAVFSGNAILNDIWPKDDGVQWNGTVRILLDYDIQNTPDPLNALSSATATLSSIFNNWPDDQDSSTYAVDCVNIDAGFLATPQSVVTRRVPVVTACVAVAGGAGWEHGCGINRISYQANVRVKLRLQLLVSSIPTSPLTETPPAPTPPPDFETTATVSAGQPWLFKVILPYGAPFGTEVQLNTSDPAATCPASLGFGPGETVQVGEGSSRTVTGAPEDDVIVTATFGALTAQAIVKVVLGQPH